MKTTTKISKVQPSNKDMLKAFGIILALAFLTIVVPFGHSFIDYFMNACFK